ncbi:MAG: PAS domain S-box protein [Rhodopirellula sp.]|nr:PAS domain S-box protein [Rhodopirellula sp.]
MSLSIDLATFIEAAGDAIIAANRSGAIVLWNPAAERLFGHSIDEAIGQSLDLIIPDRFRQRHWDAWQKTVLTGVTQYGDDILRVPAVNKDGQRISIAFTVALLPAAEGIVDVIAAIVRDETERWNEEQKLRRCLTECEKRSAAASETSEK